MPTPVMSSQEEGHVPEGVPKSVDTDMPTHMKEQESCCEEVEKLDKVASDRLIGGLMNFDRLAAQVSERHMMVDALLNLASFRGVEVDQVTPQMVRDSSAGVRGWANARIGASDGIPRP